MNKIFAVLCIVGCTLAEEKATTPDAAASRKLKTRQVSTVYHGLDYVEPIHPLNYVQESHVVGTPVHYLEPAVVSFGAAQPAAHLVHPVDQYSLHSPSIHSVYVPTAGYGQSFTYGVQSTGSALHSSPVSAATSSVSFTPGRTQQVGSVSGSGQAGAGLVQRFQSGFTQDSQQSVVGQGTQQSGFAQDSQQSVVGQGTQQSGFAQDSQQSGVGQGTQQSGFAQDSQQSGVGQGTQQSVYHQAQQIGSQESVSQTEAQTGNLQALVQQSTSQAESQQSGASQGVRVSGDAQSSTQQPGGYQYGFLQSGFGQGQQVGIVQTPTAQTSQSQVTFRQQGVGNDQGTQQSGYAVSQQSGSGSSQQSVGSFSPSVQSTVAGARQNTQSSSSQAASQQSVGRPPASTFTFNSPVFGVSPGIQSVRLIQPYNLSPSYAIHGFRNFPSGSTGGSVASSSVPVSQGTFSGLVQGSSSGSSQQSVSGSQFDGSSSQVSGDQSGSQTSFRIGSGNSGSSGIQYSYTSPQSASQPATDRSGASSSSSSQGSSSGLSAYSSFFPAGVASQGSSASVQTSQQTPAILRMSNDFNFDGSFNYGFESENGITSSAAGALRPVDRDHAAQTIAGSYSYTAPDGTPISTNYYADETGFHAQGAHLPTPPPLPEYVARALQVLPQQAGVEQPIVESN